MSLKETNEIKETEMEMTPMIDVTFLLLIFFLCTIKFKILEGKIPAYLPKDIGVNTTPVDKQLEKIEIFIQRAKTVDVEDKAWVWNENQIQIKIGPRVLSGLKEFHDLVKSVHQQQPDAKATIYPGKGTLYIDSVKVVNECLRADFVDITFGGVPKDA